MCQKNNPRLRKFSSTALTIELVVAAVDKEQRVGTARDAVDEDLGRSVLQAIPYPIINRERLASSILCSFRVRWATYGSKESVADLEVAVELTVVRVEQLYREVAGVRRVGCPQHIVRKSQHSQGNWLLAQAFDHLQLGETQVGRDRTFPVLLSVQHGMFAIGCSNER